MSNETAVVVTGPVFIASRDVNDELTKTVRAAVFPDSTPAELALYFHDCERNGVHPLDRMLHPQKRKGKYVCVTSIDLFRSRAGDTGEHAGTDDAIFVTDDDGNIVLATVTVYRLVGGLRCPYTATARWDEYYPGDGDPGFMWRKMPHTMLAKCAEALALRKAFPRVLHHLYTTEEMEQASAPPPSAKTIPAKVPTSSSASVLDGPAKGPVSTAEPVEVAVPGPDWEHRLLSALAKHYEMKAMPPSKQPGRSRWVKSNAEKIGRLVNLFYGEKNEASVSSWGLVKPSDYERIALWLEERNAKRAGNGGADAATGSTDAPPAHEVEPGDGPADQGATAGAGVPGEQAALGFDAPPPPEDDAPPPPAEPTPTELTEKLASGPLDALLQALDDLKFRSKGARRYYEIDSKTGEPFLRDGEFLTDLGYVREVNGKRGPVSQWLKTLWAKDADRVMLARRVAEALCEKETR